MTILLPITLPKELFPKSILDKHKVYSYIDFLSKNDLDITNRDHFAKRYKLLAQEVSNEKNDLILFGTPCYDASDVKALWDELKKYDCKISKVFLPSQERLNQRKQKELEVVRLHGRWVGSSEPEVEAGFKEIQESYEEIKRELPKMGIEVFEI